MSPFLVDTFTDTNGTALASHTPDTGGAWAALDFGVGDTSPGSNTIVNNNRLETNGNSTGEHHRNAVDPGADEYDITVSMTFRTPTQASRILALSWRLSPTGTSNAAVDRYVLLGRSDTTPNQWEIRKYVSGTETTIATQEQDLAGTTKTVRVEVRAGGATVFVDDTQMLSTTDTEITQRGRVGICPSRADTGNHSMDNLSAEAVSSGPSVGRDAGLGWDIDAVVVREADLDWDVHEFASRDAVLGWDVRTVVGRSAETTWNVEAIGAVGRSAPLGWDVHTTVGRSATAGWDVHDTVGRSAGLGWDVEATNTIGRNAGLGWDVHATVGRSATVGWNVTIVVGRSASAGWDLQALAGRDAVLRWTVESIAPFVYMSITVGPMRSPLEVATMRDPLAAGGMSSQPPVEVGALRDTTPTIGPLRDTGPTAGVLRDPLEVDTMRDPIHVDEMRE